MGKAKRIGNFITGLMVFTMGVLFFLFPKDGYEGVTFLLGCVYLFRGIHSLIYYFMMARHMVGGRMVFYLGLILFDLGIFTVSISDVPRFYVMLYLFIIRLITGIIDILRAMEAKNMSSAWIRKMFHGVVNILLALYCIISIKDLNTVVMVFSIGLIYSGYVTMRTAFRKTAIVYIS